MRIAQVAPLYESVPPALYGGTERVVSYLTEELVAQGHEVTLFATGDSRTDARLVPGWDRALRLDERRPEPTSLHILMIEQVMSMAAEFDVIHYHIDALQLPIARRCTTPSVTTMHGRLDLPGLMPLYTEFTDMPLVSISNAQREPMPAARWASTIYHGLPRNLHSVNGARGKYLAFLGRISPEKGVVAAIAIARASGVPLRIAAKVDAVDRDYYERSIAPLIDGDFIRYLGEFTDAQKCEFLGGALALLFPIDWPEPFGLAMIEAMACGTPVIAYRRGSVPEVIEEGRSGHIVADAADAAEAIGRLGSWDRARSRAAFEERFTAERMARDYCNVYQRAIETRKEYSWQRN